MWVPLHTLLIIGEKLRRHIFLLQDVKPARVIVEEMVSEAEKHLLQSSGYIVKGKL